MPAGSGDQGTGVSGRASPAQPEDRKEIASSLQRAGRQIASRKNGQRSVVYIVVGPEVEGPPGGKKYRRDITFVPGAIHLREGKYTRDKTSDSVEWQLVEEGSFTLRFLAESPFSEGREFDDKKNRVGTVKDDAREARYRYNLTSLTINGVPIELDPPGCPEIIIQR
jgi:hypothetical protein